jgi:type I restriction enzyme, R subunit
MLNESETRAEHIDPALAKAGWGVVEGSRVRREKSAYEITPGRIQGGGKRNKAEIADYVLEYKNHRLAVIEAKAWDKHYTEGVAQAKRYAEKLNVRFTYATNGQQIYGIDMQSGLEADVAAFPSPDELWQMTFAEQSRWRDRFSAVPFEDKGGTFQGRYYQDIAVDKVLEALCAGQDRILLTLATGTGKTFIAFQLAWKLFQSRWNVKDWKADAEPMRRPRILFLADRNILADQAYNAFSAFEDAVPGSLVRIAPDEIRKKGRVPTNGSIFFTIFQTFMSGEGETPYFGDYPADFFDFIIIDECHRGGAKDESTWRAILEYFKPAVQLGLTATPKRKANADTYAYFGDPVYSYSLKDGISDGFLTPFRVRQIASTIDDYTYTPDDSIVKGEVESGKWYEEKDFNRIIIIPEREQFRVKSFMEMIDQKQKTLVFCATQRHALMVRDFINQMKLSKDPNYCVRVTAEDGAIGDQFLRDFQDNDKSIPTILTTSQKLSTGVDARNVRNIVLMRPVNSMIEFKQIIGRGTRLYDGKDYFTIYDFVKAHKHFADPEWDGEPLAPEKTEPSAPLGTVGIREPRPEIERPQRIEVKLADGKLRRIQSMTATSFIGPDGRPMSSAQFMTHLYGKLPELFSNEDELRRVWSNPDTRIKLIEGLAEKGFDRDIMREMQKLIEAESSDLFDVLAHVAYAYDPKSRTQRADLAKKIGYDRYSDPQREFLDFILSHYETQGVDELASERLSKLLELKYHALQDATQELNASPTEIRAMFVDIQRHLYSDQTVNRNG